MLQAKEGWRSFHILNSQHANVSGAIYFHIDASVARSPLRATFGSLEFDPDLYQQIIIDFLKYVERELMLSKVTSITIKHYPIAYHPGNATLIQDCLQNLNYQITVSEIDSVIDIHRNDVRKLFHSSHRQMFDKAKAEGLLFRELTIGDLEKTYRFIDTCQEEKGYYLSMSLNQVLETADAFPDHVKVFGVFKENEMVAASIAIRVRSNVLYDFYHDHHAAFDRISPVVTLIAGLYNYCYDHDIKLLDIGTSAWNGKPNVGLLQFKRSLGARPTRKLTFYKELKQ